MVCIVVARCFRCESATVVESPESAHASSQTTTERTGLAIVELAVNHRLAIDNDRDVIIE